MQSSGRAAPGRPARTAAQISLLPTTSRRTAEATKIAAVFKPAGLRRLSPPARHVSQGCCTPAMRGLEVPTAASRACYCTHISSNDAYHPKSSVSWAWRLRCEHRAGTVWNLRRGWRQRCVQADRGGIAGASTCATAGQQTVLGPCVAAARQLRGCEACGPPLPLALCMVAPPVVAERAVHNRLLQAAHPAPFLLVQGGAQGPIGSWACIRLRAGLFMWPAWQGRSGRCRRHPLGAPS